ncbi:PadR family transcriptional regulator [Cohnella suwonensis]|uniref:PadR family transcriptional regulator n=1 Tax=Cohnella suwonensis TaxID=696072 RepID=A0ABW0LU41_9BACL
MNSQDVILGMLMKRSLTGYEIKQNFENIFAYFYSTSYGTIYPMLHRMEEEGWISKETVQQEGKPNKNVYTIAESGRSRFHDYLRSPLESETVKSDFLMRLFFGHLADTGMVIEWLRTALAQTQEQLDGLKKMYALHRDGMHPAHLICIEIGINGYTSKQATLLEGLARMEQLQREE